MALKIKDQKRFLKILLYVCQKKTVVTNISGHPVCQEQYELWKEYKELNLISL